MFYNKNDTKKINDKKVMHKVGKHWQVVSLALLMAIGGASLAVSTTHASADNTDSSQNPASINQTDTESNIHTAEPAVKKTSPQQGNSVHVPAEKAVAGDKATYTVPDNRYNQARAWNYIQNGIAGNKYDDTDPYTDYFDPRFKKPGYNGKVSNDNQRFSINAGRDLKNGTKTPQELNNDAYYALGQPDYEKFIKQTPQLRGTKDYYQPHVSDDVKFVKNGGNIIGRSRVSGAGNTEWTPGNKPNGMPEHYHATDPNGAYYYGDGYFKVGSSLDTVTDEINFMDGRTKKGSVVQKGAYGTRGTVKPADVPAHYHVTGDSGFTFTGGSHDVPVAIDQVADKVDYIDRGQDEGTATVKGAYGSDVADNGAGLKVHYHLNDDGSQDFHLDAGSHNVGVAKDQVTDTVYYKDNGEVVGTSRLNGVYGDDETADTDVPSHYQLLGDGSQEFSLNGGKHSVNVGLADAHDTIDFMNGDDKVGSSNVNGVYSETRFANVNVPEHYHLKADGTQQFRLDNGEHKVDVVPDNVNDTIDYKLNGKTISVGALSGAYGSEATVVGKDLASHYHVVNDGSQNILLNAGRHTIKVVPDMMTDTIDYVSHGKKVASNVQWGRYQTNGSADDVPGDYRISDGNGDFRFDGGEHMVNVVSVPQEKPAVDDDTSGTAKTTVEFHSGDKPVGAVTVSGPKGSEQTVQIPKGYSIMRGGSDRIVNDGQTFDMNLNRAETRKTANSADTNNDGTRSRISTPNNVNSTSKDATDESSSASVSNASSSDSRQDIDKTRLFNRAESDYLNKAVSSASVRDMQSAESSLASVDAEKSQFRAVSASESVAASSVDAMASREAAESSTASSESVSASVAEASQASLQSSSAVRSSIARVQSSRASASQSAAKSSSVDSEERSLASSVENVLSGSDGLGDQLASQYVEDFYLNNADYERSREQSYSMGTRSASANPFFADDGAIMPSSSVDKPQSSNRASRPASASSSITDDDILYQPDYAAVQGPIYLNRTGTERARKVRRHRRVTRRRRRRTRRTRITRSRWHTRGRIRRRSRRMHHKSKGRRRVRHRKKK